MYYKHTASTRAAALPPRVTAGGGPGGGGGCADLSAICRPSSNSQPLNWAIETCVRQPVSGWHGVAPPTKHSAQGVYLERGAQREEGDGIPGGHCCRRLR